MKEIKAKEMRALEIIELKAKYKDLKEEQFNLRYQMAIGQCTNPARFKQVRHDIARLQSVAKDKNITF